MSILTEEQYRTIIQTAIDGFWMVNQQGRFLDVNEAACRMLGYTREEFLKLHIPDIEVNETQYRCKDGTIIDVQMKIRPLNAEKDIFCVFIRDITEKIKTLKTLENSKKRYRTLFENAPVMYVIAENQKGFPIVSDCNKLFLKILGYRRTDVIGKPLAVFYTDKSQKRMMKDTDSKRDMEKHFTTAERELLTHDGKIVHTFLQAVPEYDTQGKEKGTRVMFIDISAQKRADEQLIESQNMLQMIVDGISDPMIMVDKQMNVLMHNMAAMKYYGVNFKKNCISRKCHEIFSGHSNPCKGCIIPLAVSTLKHAAFERKGFLDPEKLEQITLYPIKEKDHEWAAIIRINDITKTRQMEKELIQADKMISLGILVSGVAHEINNPNNFIMMNTSILQEAWENIVALLEDYYRKTGDFTLAGLPYSEMRNEIPLLFKGVIEGAERIKQIVEDLKDYARQNGTDMDQSVNVNTGLKKAVRLTRDLIKKSTGNFKVKYGHNLPLIKGNEQKLQQVFINLIQNACQALPNKEKGFFIRSSFDKAGQTIIIDMQDEGHGIHENLLDRIMDPFFTTRRAEGGTGLGLSISSNILKAHGGKIKVKSKINKGACFRIILPINKIETSVKILVSDDDPGIRRFLCLELEKHKHCSVREACTGNEAIFEIGQQIPDLLILDVNMPDMNGVEVCRLLKKNHKLSHIKVIIITGFPESSLVKEIVRMGFDKILPKPFRTSTFLEMVDKALETEK